MNETCNRAGRGQSVAVAEPWEKMAEELDALSSQ